MDKELDQLLETVLHSHSFSDEVLRQTEWVVGDTMISLLYGLQSEKEVVRYQEKVRNDAGFFPILGTNRWTNRKDNLIIHGTAIVANELDEGHSLAKGHPSAHILPTILVSAYENDVTTEKFLDVYIKAYEIASRLAYASRMRDDMHPHGTWGNVGGAVARALIEGKGKKEIKEIILLTLTLPLSTAWLSAEKGQSVRNLYTGIGSFLAYESVSFQEYGFTSNIEVVESLWSTIMGDGMDNEKLVDSLIDPPLITKNYFKVHPTCRFTHAAIDAAIEILKDNSFLVTEIEGVIVETYNLAARCDTSKPQTKLQSKFSIPYAVACTLMGMDLFENYADNLGEVEQLSNKIVVKESEALTDLLPNKRAATIEVRLKDGSLFTHTIDNAQGESTHRFSEERMWKKYENMLANHYSSDFFKVLSNHLLDLRTCSTVKEWLQINQLMEGSL